MFRSQAMGYYNLIIPRESAWEIMNRLGELGALHFVDLNKNNGALAQDLVKPMKRCDEIENKLKFIEGEMKKFGLELRIIEQPGTYIDNLRNFLEARGKVEQTYFEEIEAEIDMKAQYFRQQSKTFDDLAEKKRHLLEFLQVIEKTRGYISGLFSHPARRRGMNLGISQDDPDIGGMRLSFITGTIPTEDAMRFTRMLFRLTRGNVWTILQEVSDIHIDDSFFEMETSKSEKRSVFLLIFHGGDRIKNTLIKVCDSFASSRYNIPEDESSIDSHIRVIQSQLDEVDHVRQYTFRLFLIPCAHRCSESPRVSYTRASNTS